MAFTTDQLSALEIAYATGRTEVMFQGRRDVFASGDDLLRRINVMKAAIAAAGTAKPVQIINIIQDDQ